MPGPLLRGYLCSVAGVNCFDFSNMGAGKKFLGTSAMPFLLWAVERLFSCEDFFVVECIPPFHDVTLADMMKDAFTLHTLRVCPSILGLPITRDKKYMIFLSKRLAWAPEILGVDLQEAFCKLVQR